MKAYVICVSFLFALIASGDSLKCVVCSNLNGGSCNGTETECNANVTSCGASVIEATYGNYTRLMAFKTCSEIPACSSFFLSESFVDVQLRLQKNCCSTDNCNSARTVLPPKDKTLNGVKCPTCYAQNDTSCKPNTTLSCTGPETKCVSFGGKVYAFDEEGSTELITIAYEGCATKEPCGHPIPLYPASNVVEVDHFKCTDGPGN